jgi:antitoxin PrlF
MGKEELRMADSTGSSYRIEAVVSVDERGQMVLPKELRQRAGIGAGDKLALVAFEDKGEICCISFFKVDDLSGMVRDKLGPVMQGALGS